MRISNQDCQFTARDGKPYDARISAPEDDEKYTAIVVMPAIFGIDDSVKQAMETYAEAGFLVCAPDYFFRTVPGPAASMEAAVERMKIHDIEQTVLDMEDTIAQIRALPQSNGKVAVLGVCFGGLFAYLSAVRLNADAIGAFHGTRIHDYLNEANELRVPASLHYGSDDPVVPLDQVEMIKKAFAEKADCEIVVHDGGKHNFSMPNKPGYDASIARSATESVLATFKTI